MLDFPEFKMERIVFYAVDRPFGWWGKFINRILKWLHFNWDDSIVYFDVDKKN